MMGRALLRTAASAAVIVFAAVPALAQPAAADPQAAKVRQILLAGTTPTPAEKAEILKAVKERTDEMWKLEDNGDVPIASVMEKLRIRMHPVILDHLTNNPPFVKTIAEIYQEALMPLLTDANNKPAHLSAYFQAGYVLTSFRDPALAASYMKLADLPAEVPGLRFRVLWAMQAPAFRAELTTGANAQKLRAFLVDRCRKETAIGVMGEVFNAMDLTGTDDKTALSLVLAGLRARLDNYLAGNMAGIGAEPRALEIIEKIRNTNEGLFNTAKPEVIELVGKLLHVAGTCYTEFNQERVDLLRIQRVPVAQVRLGVWDTVIMSDRILTAVLAGMKDAGVKSPAVEKAFLELMTSVVDSSGRSLGQDPVEQLYRPDTTPTTVYIPFLKQLEDRRTQVTAVLKAAKYANSEIPDPKEWKVSDEPGAAAPAPAAPKAKKEPVKPAKK